MEAGGDPERVLGFCRLLCVVYHFGADGKMFHGSQGRVGWRVPGGQTARRVEDQLCE